MEDHHQLAGRRIMVTGASGFIGSHLCQDLCLRGAEVHAVSRGWHPDGDVRWWQSNLCDIAAVRELLFNIKPETIFHLSGDVTAAPDFHLALSTFESHVVSTVYLLAVAAEMGCRRIVLTASLTEPQGKASDIVPSSPYAAGKWASCVYGRMFHTLYETPITIVRPFMAYGPRQNPQKIIPYVTLSLLRGEVPKLASGRWQADWIYIDDVIEGLLAAGDRSGVEGCTIDLGSGMMTTVREVVDHIVRLVGTSIIPSFGVLPDRPAEKIRVADLAYARDKIGWTPTITLQDGLARTVDWFREQVHTVPASVQPMEDLR